MVHLKIDIYRLQPDIDANRVQQAIPHRIFNWGLEHGGRYILSNGPRGFGTVALAYLPVPQRDLFVEHKALLHVYRSGVAQYVAPNYLKQALLDFGAELERSTAGEQYAFYSPKLVEAFDRCKRGVSPSKPINLEDAASMTLLTVM
jgi:hypothetical protein